MPKRFDVLLIWCAHSIEEGSSADCRNVALRNRFRSVRWVSVYSGLLWDWREAAKFVEEVEYENDVGLRGLRFCIYGYGESIPVGMKIEWANPGTEQDRSVA